MACLRDPKDKTYPINACTGTNHTRHFAAAGSKGFYINTLKKLDR